MANESGSLRRSQLVTTYGPGSILNLRSPKGAPISAITGGIETWDKTAPPRGLVNPQRCHLSRLERKLEVQGFRLPPVDLSDRNNASYIASKRFPMWLTCPKCNVLKRENQWQRDNDVPGVERWCPTCSQKGAPRVYVVPVRFVMTCDKGHLGEFPWSYWLKTRGNQTENSKDCGHTKFSLSQGKSLSLSSLFLKCTECSSYASMNGIFSEQAFQGLNCNGESPWLSGNIQEECDRHPKIVQRNSSSLYLPKFESAIDIPPWEHTLQEKLGDWWHRLYSKTEETRKHYIESVIEDINNESCTDYSPESLNAEITRLCSLDDESSDDLKIDEYEQFINEKNQLSSVNPEFKVKHFKPTKNIARLVNKIVAVERLREVKAIYGFTRLKEMNPICKISASSLNWLPAIEVRGEGIFLEISEKFLADILKSEENKNRITSLIEDCQAHAESSQTQQLVNSVTPELIIIHTLSHLFISEISLQCGYSASSLSERIYAHNGMRGILIYTSTPDSEGTLGGLSGLAKPLRLEKILLRALEKAKWCSSDPLCFEKVLTISEPLNGAACHSCLLLPETTCELMNYYLDRGMLTDTSYIL